MKGTYLASLGLGLFNIAQAKEEAPNEISVGTSQKLYTSYEVELVTKPHVFTSNYIYTLTYTTTNSEGSTTGRSLCPSRYHQVSNGL